MKQSNSIDLKVQDFAIYTKPKLRGGLLIRILFESFAWVILASPFISGLWIGARRAGEIMGSWLGAPIIALFFAFTLFRRLSRRFGFDSQDRLLKDTDPPVLYLRPFKYDSGGHFWRFDRRSLEELLAWNLDDIGPVVAVGRPLETLPLLGAVRLYFGNEEWQEKVESLMKISKLVVIQPGKSEFVEWELQKALSILRPDQVLISFLAWRGLGEKLRRDEFKEFRLLIEKTLKKHVIAHPDDVDKVWFMSFKSDWTPILVYWDEDESAPLYKNVYAEDIGVVLRSVFGNKPAKIGIIQHISGLLFYPNKVFEYLDYKPSWLFPMLATIVLQAGYIIAADNIKGTFSSESVLAGILFPLTITIALMFYSGIFSLALVIFYRDIGFRKLFSVMTWSNLEMSLLWMPTIFYMALNILWESTTGQATLFTKPEIDVSSWPLWLWGGLLGIWFFALVTIGFTVIINARRQNKIKITRVKMGSFVLSVPLGITFLVYLLL